MSADAGRSELLRERLCACGFPWSQTFQEDRELDNIETILGIDTPSHTVEDVIERSCPHENGTLLRSCPQCGTVVSMWGMGPAGSMECPCWVPPSDRPQHSPTVQSPEP